MFLATFLVDRLRGLGRHGVPLATKETVQLAGLLLDWLMLNRGGLVLAAKETVPLAGLLLDRLMLNRGGLVLAAKEAATRPTLLVDWLVLNRLLGFVTRKEGHVDGGWGIGTDGQAFVEEGWLT